MLYLQERMRGQEHMHEGSITLVVVVGGGGDATTGQGFPKPEPI